MASLNKWHGIGNIGRDPETKYLPNGDCVCNMSIACTESYKDKNTGEKKEVTEWVRLVLFRKLAELASTHVKKGSQLYIEGKMQTRKWTDKDGIERYSTEIVVDSMQFLGSKGPQKENNDSGYEPAPRKEQPARSAQGATRDSFDNMSDDIPFACLGHGKVWRVI